MPLIDMPLDELKKYQGSSPCPKDIDTYWDMAIAEMKAIDPKVELIPSDFQVSFAECFDLYYTGVKGARIHAKLLRPKNVKSPQPAILQFHGYTGNSGEWSNKLGFVANGFTVAALDCRGQGGLSEDVGGVKGNTLRGQIIRGLEDSPKDLLFRHIFLDAAQLAGIVMAMPEVDENRVGAMGYSQGGGLTLACGSLEPRIKRLAPIHPFLSDYKRVWDMDLAKNAYEDIGIFFRLFDPLHQREDEIFHKLGYIDIQNLVKRIKGQVLMATGLLDTTCPPSTVFAAYNKITSQKELKLYPDYEHEGLPGFEDMLYQFMFAL
jgi:cephalosporin-C deacetylase